LLARARPSAAVRSLTPLAPGPRAGTTARAHLTPRSLHRRRRRMSAPLSIGRHSPAHAPRGQQRGAAVHVVHPPDAQARDRAVAPRAGLAAQGGRSVTPAYEPGRRALRPCGGRRIARTGPSLVANPGLRPGGSRYRSSLCPAKAGAKNPPAKKPAHECRSRVVCLLNAQADPTAQAMGGHGPTPAR
jgi:hypothetical protein